MTITQRTSQLRRTSSRAAARNTIFDRTCPRKYDVIDAESIRGLLDVAVRGRAFIQPGRPNTQGREWALLDSDQSDPGTYTIRTWTDAIGRARPVDTPPVRRYGGAIGLFTRESGFASVGPSPAGVDEGAGLLLFGFASMMALPLPAATESLFNANWLLVLSPFPNNFDDCEVNRILLLSWAFLCDAERSPSPTRSSNRGLRGSFSQSE